MFYLRITILGLTFAEAARKRFIWLTDTHSDPYYGTAAQAPGGKPSSVTEANTWGTMGNDPGYDMLQSAVTAAAKLGNDPAFLLYSGDFARHYPNYMPSPWENVTDIVRKDIEIMAASFPDLIAAGRFSLGAQGNDDAPENYWFPFTANQTTNPWAENLAETFTESGAFSPKEAHNYSYGGAFSTEIGGLQIITINTIIYSVKHKPGIPMGKDPFGQFAWLESQLEIAKARGRPAWIVGHIPPGIETYGFTELWKNEYVVKYLAVVQNEVLSPYIAAQLFGHVHACEFRLFPEPDAQTGPILLSGALSPVYYNNPAFRVIEFDSDSFRPVGMAIYSATLSPGATPLKWHLALNITNAYDSLHSAVLRDGFLSQMAYVDLAKDLSKGGADWNTYSKWYKANYTSALWAYGCDPLASAGTEAPDMAGVVKYICATDVTMTEDALRACVNSTTPQVCSYAHDDETDIDDIIDDGSNDGDIADIAELTAGQIIAFIIGVISLVGVMVAAIYLKKTAPPRNNESFSTELVDDVVTPLTTSSP